MEGLDYIEAVGIRVYELQKLAIEFDAESYLFEKKIHKFPPNLGRQMSDQFIVPTALAIGPYHHRSPHVQEMEKMKKVAAYHLVSGSGHSLEEVFSTVRTVAEEARRLYADDAVEGISSDEFASMMFRDACFLLQYMHQYSGEGILDPSLRRYFSSNRACIDNDIMLLENQLPWVVIEAMMTITPAPVKEFILTMGRTMQIWPDDSQVSAGPLVMSESRPPHLLGLLRLHKIRVSSMQGRPAPYDATIHEEVVSLPVRATELAGIGIRLFRPSLQAGHSFSDMGVAMGRLFDKLFLASLNLNRTRASWLINMAAFEVCTASVYYSRNMEDTSICSYIAVLAMLMDQEEDVNKLRSKGFIHGDLSDMQILSLFKAVSQQMDPGVRYFQILNRIEACKRRRWLRIMMYKFVSDNAKTIAGVVSAVSVLVGIFTALFSLKQQ